MNIDADKLPESCECCLYNDDYYRCVLSGDLFDEHEQVTGKLKNSEDSTLSTR